MVTVAFQAPILTIGESHQPLMYKIFLLAFMVLGIGGAVAVSAWRRWRNK